MESKFISDTLSIIIPDMLNNLSKKSKFKTYLTLLSLVGWGFVLMVTHKYGAGVSSDAARNLATAESLLQGKGFVDMLGGSFVLWPPLYPLLLAGLSLAHQMQHISSGVVFECHSLSAQSLAVRLAVFFDLQREIALCCFRWAGFIVFALHASHLCQRRLRAVVRHVHANFLFRGGALFTNMISRSMLWLMFVSAGLATLQRYLGVILIGVGGLVVLFKDGWRRLPRAILPALVAALPIALWGVFHNLPLSGGFSVRVILERCCHLKTSISR